MDDTTFGMAIVAFVLSATPAEMEDEVRKKARRWAEGWSAPWFLTPAHEKPVQSEETQGWPINRMKQVDEAEEEVPTETVGEGSGR